MDFIKSEKKNESFQFIEILKQTLSSQRTKYSWVSYLIQFMLSYDQRAKIRINDKIAQQKSDLAL